MKEEIKELTDINGYEFRLCLECLDVQKVKYSCCRTCGYSMLFYRTEKGALKEMLSYLDNQIKELKAKRYDVQIQIAKLGDN